MVRSEGGARTPTGRMVHQGKRGAENRNANPFGVGLADNDAGWLWGFNTLSAREGLGRMMVDETTNCSPAVRTTCTPMPDSRLGSGRRWHAICTRTPSPRAPPHGYMESMKRPRKNPIKESARSGAPRRPPRSSRRPFPMSAIRILQFRRARRQVFRGKRSHQSDDSSHQLLREPNSGGSFSSRTRA